ncbi:acetyl-CoA carboxylase biotin carboxylase subunit [Ochrobactrum sp. 19YEA23]|uniref:acetyl-CoA carboxylase biotin carboxylase subunit n=1 Tax=Ochrobactrum sp. 19YEA23 TaxID=3039854 RepID=UPI002478579B|nr:acetyl-CoA carboxylase biotin carboxylase subunit [Ochrobactrum sp. 19YEA23]
MISKVLIANRGEIAVRIQRACTEMQIPYVQAYSEGDAGAPYVQRAEEAICIGPASPRESYLNKSAIVFAALSCGADAIHPGYGFLSENFGFVEAVENCGLTFVGPSASAIYLMGDKVRARTTMAVAGVPCLPGSEGALSSSISEQQNLARKIGYPVIIKASGGGGGRGMRVVHNEAELSDAIAITREEARNAFGNPEVYLEKFLTNPRHVEIQVLIDSHGNGVWLGERDCSMQRRHQKIVEEAPAPHISRDLISQVAEQCLEACRQINYRGAGTFEFLYEDGALYFIEMNTRLQVEHTVTEAITGVDIVQAQLRIARGEKLGFSQQDVILKGHALECRINAEDPQSFLPSPGTISEWIVPSSEHVRIDSHIEEGYEIPRHYDSMIGKIIVWGENRQEAIERMQNALRMTRLKGVQTNIPLHQIILQNPDFCAGGTNIHFLERRIIGAGGTAA